jgi:hypothetical protein
MLISEILTSFKPKACLLLHFTKKMTMKDIMLIFHELGLVLILGSAFIFLIMKSNLRYMQSLDVDRFYKISNKFRVMTYIGFGIMILSGGYLMTPYWSAFGSFPMIHIKMTIVIIWLLSMAVLGMSSKNLKHNFPIKYYSRLVLMYSLSLIFGIFTVIIATFSFH